MGLRIDHRGADLVKKSLQRMAAAGKQKTPTIAIGINVSDSLFF